MRVVQAEMEQIEYAVAAAQGEYFLASIGHDQCESIIAGKVAFQFLNSFPEVHAFAPATLRLLNLQLTRGRRVRRDFFPKGDPSRELLFRDRAVILTFIG